MIGPARGEGWRFIELDAPRNAMMTHPDEVADEYINRLEAYYKYFTDSWGITLSPVARWWRISWPPWYST